MMAIVTFLVKLKKPSQLKRKAWQAQQKEYAKCVNWCVENIPKNKKISSAHVPHNLKSAIKNEAIRRAKKARNEKGLAGKIPVFKSTTPISINNQNWSPVQKNGRWYISFTMNDGRKVMPIEESEHVLTYFPHVLKREHRGTMQLLRKGKEWYCAIPIEISSEVKNYSVLPQTTIGVDLGLCHIAVACEPKSGKRMFVSGKQIGVVRRRFRSIRKSLAKKKALRAIKSLNHKESRIVQDFNRKLAKRIVDFALQFEKPVIKLEDLDSIRKTCKTTRRADRTIHSWAFYQLKKFICEYASKRGVMVQDVDPYKTSQRCFKCEHAVRENRKGRKFKCVNCGHTDHADLNAAKNISSSMSLAV